MIKCSLHRGGGVMIRFPLHQGDVCSGVLYTGVYHDQVSSRQWVVMIRCLRRGVVMIRCPLDSGLS